MKCSGGVTCGSEQELRRPPWVPHLSLCRFRLEALPLAIVLTAVGAVQGELGRQRGMLAAISAGPLMMLGRKSNRGACTAGVPPAFAGIPMQARCLRYNGFHRPSVPLRSGGGICHGSWVFSYQFTRASPRSRQPPSAILQTSRKHSALDTPAPVVQNPFRYSPMAVVLRAM